MSSALNSAMRIGHSEEDPPEEPQDMKQDTDKQSLPPLNNSSQAMFSGMSSAAAASFSMLTPEQILAASRTAALMAVGLPISFNGTMVTAPSIYHQSIFGSWVPPVASSPPPSLSLVAASVTPVLSIKGTSRRNSSTTNNNINNNNNNVVSSSADRVGKKGQGTKKKSTKSKVDTTQPSLEGTAPLSPPTSISPEAGRDNRDKVFTCGVCLRSFGYKHVLQNHERTHTGEKPFECQQCHKRFTRDHHLKTHMRLHTGEKPYHCEQCDRYFVQVANLRRHLRVHTGERPYACELCTAKFSDSNQLKAHVLIHKGEKPFECEKCLMRFRRRHHLIHHKCSTSGNSGIQVQQSQTNSPSMSNDNQEEDVDIDGEIEASESCTLTAGTAITPPIMTTPIDHRLSSPVVDTAMTMPLNLSAMPVNIPEQTEPEDLSMSTGMHRVHSHSNSSGDSAMSRSPSTETVQEEDYSELDVSDSPNNLFPRSNPNHQNKYGHPQHNPATSKVSPSS